MSDTPLIADVQQEQRVYNFYRSVLRAERRKGTTVDPSYSDIRPRAAARRQTARKLTVEHYNIPFGEVKRIVSKLDVNNGITHEHTPQYLQMLEFTAAVEEFEKNPHPCSCGSTELVRVRATPDDREDAVFSTITSCYICYRNLENDN
jgi:hypothetical protein